MKLLIVLLALCTPFFARSQEKGIQWTNNLTWEQIEQKARQENKYIFVDCYTTWCGPCKMMDKEVYLDDSVGKYFNERFISVKVQMDKTDGDDERVKSWYNQAIILATRFRINAYPSYVFLSPEGKIVHQSSGFQQPSQFIATAATALAPGKDYDDPYVRYTQLLENYLRGTSLHFSDLPFMIKTAEESGDTTHRQQFMKEFKGRMYLVPKEQLYTKENIKFMSSLNLSSKSEIFPVFFKNADKVNGVMEKKNFAENVVDNIIKYETIIPFLGINNTGVARVDGKPLEILPEPNWNQLADIIKNKYNKSYAKRCIIDAKMIWYDNQKQHKAWAKYFIQKTESEGIDTSERGWALKLNKASWKIFLGSDDKQHLITAIGWMKKVLPASEKYHPGARADILDTYAGLLYKTGNKVEALEWQQKAVTTTVSIDAEKSHRFQITLDRMKNNEPIWEGQQ